MAASNRLFKESRLLTDDTDEVVESVVEVVELEFCPCMVASEDWKALNKVLCKSEVMLPDDTRFSRVFVMESILSGLSSGGGGGGGILCVFLSASKAL